MAHIDAAPASGRRRQDAVLNLVPYVDMLMTLMAFLVMSAVWTSMAALPVSVGGGGAAAVAPEETPPLEARVTRDGVEVGSGEARGLHRWTERGALVAAWKAARGASPDAALQLVIDDDVPFERMAAVVDDARASGFDAPQISFVR